jgi:hypothetical protein
MGCTYDTREFRNWRHEVESTVAHAWALGFKLPGEFKSRPRAYRAMWIGASLSIIVMPSFATWMTPWGSCVF